MGGHEVDIGSRADVRTSRFGIDSTAWDPIRRRRASAYGAGPELDDALAGCRRLAACGLTSTVGYSAGPDEPARHVADTELAAFERLSADDVDCHVAVKLSALGFDAALFAELEAAGARTRRRLHVDSLGPETADRTWRLLERAGRAGTLGITLPGRWRRSIDDAARAAELGLAVRVVKGQWPEGVGAGADAAEGFLRVVDRLRGHAHGVAVATHDVRLLTESLRRLTRAGTPCEAELFFGLPFRPPALAARELGVPIRVYVPYGRVGAPYGVADLTRNPAAAWWLAQDLLLGRDKLWRSVRRRHSLP